MGGFRRPPKSAWLGCGCRTRDESRQHKRRKGSLCSFAFTMDFRFLPQGSFLPSASAYMEFGLILSYCCALWCSDVWWRGGIFYRTGVSWFGRSGWFSSNLVPDHWIIRCVFVCVRARVVFLGEGVFSCDIQGGTRFSTGIVRDVALCTLNTIQYHHKRLFDGDEECRGYVGGFWL